MRGFVNIILWIWQAPQNLLGLLFRLVYGQPNARFQGVKVVVSGRFRGGISLGRTIFIQTQYWHRPEAWMHEYGHTRQSLYLGPLYLFVIGIPSLLWAWYWTPARGVSYYSFFTEKWADRLGGVIK